jgi:methylamine utilization protein MauE
MAEIAYSLSLLAAALFVLAGLIKLRHPIVFLQELEDYRLLPRSVLIPVAAVLPLTEIAAGILTALPSTYRLGAALLIGLLAVFTAVVVTAIVRGLTAIRCACLGSFSQRLSWAIPVRNALLAAALVAALAVPAKQPSGAGLVGAALLWLLGWLIVEGSKSPLRIREVRT